MAVPEEPTPDDGDDPVDLGTGLFIFEEDRSVLTGYSTYRFNANLSTRGLHLRGSCGPLVSDRPTMYELFLFPDLRASKKSI